jgi:hypothetical protein
MAGTHLNRKSGGRSSARSGMCVHSLLRKDQAGKSDATSGIDALPRWTKEDPARYVERTAQCNNCSFRSRMIPIDPSIPNVRDTALAKFWEEAEGQAAERQIASLSKNVATSSRKPLRRGENRKSGHPPKRDQRVAELIVKNASITSVPVHCGHCHKPGRDDLKPCFEKSTGKYVVMERSNCESPECLRVKREFFPQKKSIAYVRYHTLYVKAWRRGKAKERESASKR